MNFKEIKELINIVDNSNLNELSIEQDNFKINLKKGCGTSVFQSASNAGQTNDEIYNEGINKAEKDLKENTADTSDLHLIKSPIVGTFYGSPNPEAEPYVKIGSHVNKGDILCIIEAMKLMNEIDSDADGEIVQVFVKDNELVEYGQPLFAVRMV